MSQTGVGFFSLLTTDDYVKGVLVLNESLKEHCNGFTHLTCLMTNKVTNSTVNMLHSNGINTLVVSEPENIAFKGEYVAQIRRQMLTGVFGKINLWKLTEYRKIIYLDAGASETGHKSCFVLTSPIDTYVVDNIDDLMSIEHEFAASPDIMADFFNSGVMVIRPSEAVYKDLLELLASGWVINSGGDQGLLNSYYLNFYQNPKCKQLSFGFNYPYFLLTQLGNSYAVKYLMETNRLKIIHFWGNHKPWSSHFKSEVAYPPAQVFVQKYLDTLSKIDNSSK